jgi:hypothetical protein
MIFQLQVVAPCILVNNFVVEVAYRNQELDWVERGAGFEDPERLRPFRSGIVLHHWLYSIHAMLFAVVRAASWAWVLEVMASRTRRWFALQRTIRISM